MKRTSKTMFILFWLMVVGIIGLNFYDNGPFSGLAVLLLVLNAYTIAYDRGRSVQIKRQIRELFLEFLAAKKELKTKEGPNI